MPLLAHPLHGQPACHGPRLPLRVATDHGLAWRGDPILGCGSNPWRGSTGQSHAGRALAGVTIRSIAWPTCSRLPVRSGPFHAQARPSPSGPDATAAPSPLQSAPMRTSARLGCRSAPRISRAPHAYAGLDCRLHGTPRTDSACQASNPAATPGQSRNSSLPPWLAFPSYRVRADDWTRPTLPWLPLQDNPSQSVPLLGCRSMDAPWRSEPIRSLALISCRFAPERAAA